MTGSIEWATAFICGTILAIFFAGEPDIHCRIVGDCGETELRQEDAAQ